MAKRPKPEEIVAKLRQADVLISQGQTVAEAIRAIAVSEVIPGWARCPDLLRGAAGALAADTLTLRLGFAARLGWGRGASDRRAWPRDDGRGTDCLGLSFRQVTVLRLSPSGIDWVTPGCHQRDG